MKSILARTPRKYLPGGRLLIVGLAMTLVSTLAAAQQTRTDSSLEDRDSADPVNETAPHRILVVLKQIPSPPLQRPGSTARPYGGRAVYSTTSRSRRIAAHIARDYELQQVDSWPIELLGVNCVVYEVPVQDRIEPLLERLSQDSRVEMSQKMNRFHVLGRAKQDTEREDDPYLYLQYSIESMQVREAHHWARGEGVKIAIVDTGLDASHPDLAGNVARLENFVGDDDSQVAGEVHGTAVAGVIASAAGNGIGIVGVAPAARILSLRACWDEPRSGGSAVCNSFTLAKAISFAIENGAGVLNLSLTGPSDALLERLLLVALKRGIVVVAAEQEHAEDGAGSEEGFPASVPGVLRVGSAAAEAWLRPRAPPHNRASSRRRSSTPALPWPKSTRAWIARSPAMGDSRSVQ
ncbi:MAG: S8 family serine peptidase [Acidobacteriota bacterium]